jgi:uncharacterized membrane protein YfbV (UPF0208 family)
MAIEDIISQLKNSTEPSVLGGDPNEEMWRHHDQICDLFNKNFIMQGTELGMRVAVLVAILAVQISFTEDVKSCAIKAGIELVRLSMSIEQQRQEMESEEDE